jgi:isopenicillin-N N-acyltransferase like protein
MAMGLPARRGGAPVMALLALLALLAFTAGPSSGCTLWAATGVNVSGNGTLVGKNRDNSKELTTVLKVVSREGGFPFIGLFDPEALGYVIAGINEKGLTVVNASAGSLPDEKRNVAKEDLTDRLLTFFSGVDGVVREEAMFAGSHPAFYMIADTEKVALIEVAPGGKTSIKVIRNGILTHTNHYTDDALLASNERPAANSRKRLKRINRLLAGSPPPLSLERFISLSEDRSDSRNDSIFRACSPETKVCTLATWVVSLPKGGFPELYLKIVKSDYTEEVKRLKLDDGFWARAPVKPDP